MKKNSALINYNSLWDWQPPVFPTYKTGSHSARLTIILTCFVLKQIRTCCITRHLVSILSLDPFLLFSLHCICPLSRLTAHFSISKMNYCLCQTNGNEMPVVLRRQVSHWGSGSEDPEDWHFRLSWLQVIFCSLKYAHGWLKNYLLVSPIRLSWSSDYDHPKKECKDDEFKWQSKVLGASKVAWI